MNLVEVLVLDAGEKTKYTGWELSQENSWNLNI